MHPIFQNRDILDEICYWLRRKHLVATIRVNKTWSAASVGPLWKSIDLVSALKLLGPLVPLCRHQTYTSENITLDKWKRFIYYARHVRVLRVSGDDSFAILAAVTSRPCSLEKELIYFFPQCRLLHWTTTRDQPNSVNLDVLMPPTLDQVYIIGVFVTMDRIWFNKFCKSVAGLPSLRVFRLTQDLLMGGIRSSDLFYSLLTKFASTLTHVQVPDVLFTQATIETLRNSPSLRSLSVGDDERGLQNPVLTTRYTTQNGGGFTSLKTLVFSGCSSKLMHQPVLEFCRSSFPALTTLSWDIVDSNLDVHAFILTIARTCPSLHELKLRGWSKNEIPWSSVRPLLGFEKLYSLALRCARVDITPGDWVELLGSRQAPWYWRELEILTSKPFHFQDALFSVAKYSPGINSLGLRVHNQNQSFSAGIWSLDPDEMNDNTQREYIKRVRQTGLSLPSLSNLLLLDDDGPGLRPKSAWPVASLLLAICEKGVKITGDKMVRLEIVAHMEDHYEYLERFGGEETATVAKRYLKFYRYQKEACLI